MNALMTATNYLTIQSMGDALIGAASWMTENWDNIRAQLDPRPTAIIIDPYLPRDLYSHGETCRQAVNFTQGRREAYIELNRRFKHNTGRDIHEFARPGYFGG